MIGSRIGGYEIVSRLGEGGMGAVYRARDTKLNRDVAIKVLLPEVANDPDRLARFRREAQVLASLNHPHIAQIYGLEEERLSAETAVTVALVMELVEGPTLADLIAQASGSKQASGCRLQATGSSQRDSTGVRKPEAQSPKPSRGLAVPDVVAIATQIAEGLEAAHEQGIVHRDLKPANIKVRPDGTVKVLDFGLAKALDTNPASATADNSPTITTPAMTQAGIILGTAAYMSPEQARGAAVDKRADIWAFGAILFEMLSGRRLFTGDTVSDTLAGVLRDAIDLTVLPVETPAAVRRLLGRCLARDRRQRLQDIGDARIELTEAAEPESQAVETPAARSARTRWLPLAGTFIAGVAAALLSAVAWSSLDDPTATDSGGRSYSFLITPADGVALEDPPTFQVSPDGRSIALRGFEGGVSYWYLRDLATGATRRLNSTMGSSIGLAWSPDSAWILFERQSAMHKVAVDDTRLERVSERGAFLRSNLAWSPSDEFLRIDSGRLVGSRGQGAADRTIIEANPSRSLVWPWPLPDGRRALVGDLSNPAGVILLANMDGSEQPRALETGVQPAFAEPGWLLAVRGRQLLAWPFDRARGVIEGLPQVVHDGVRQSTLITQRLFSVSQAGVLAVRNVAPGQVTQLIWFDRSGAEGAPLKLASHCRNPEFSRDHRRLAMECYEEGTDNRDIWVYDLARDSASRFTVDPGDDADPVWSPDDQTIAFASNRLGPVDVFRKGAGGATAEELLIETPGSTPVMAWSPDGKTMALMQSTGMDLVAFDVGTSQILAPIVESPFTDLEAQFSPDGRFLSYSSDESGRAEIYVQPWPHTGEKWQVSTDGGTDARWRPDSRELFYLNPTRDLMAASLDTRSGFRAAAPVRLFQTRIAGPLGSGHRFPYAVSADGQRFVMYVRERNAPPPSINVIVNWPARLKK